MKINFLQGKTALTKAYKQTSQGIEKTSYPHMFEVTSHEVSITNLTDFEAALKLHAKRGNCLLKGELTRVLVNESRAGTTDRNGTTQWICLDLDGLPSQFELMDKHQVPYTIKYDIPSLLKDLELDDVSYILQWSASHGISDPGIRAHVIMLLDRPVSVPLIKQWLIQLNHTTPILRENTTLTKTACSLSWVLDITACQNDKLIYIAPPTLSGIKDPMGKTPRISIVKRAKSHFTFPAVVNSIATNRDLTDTRIHELRALANMPKRKITYKLVGPHEVMVKPDASIITEMKQERGFVYFNLNGGDSWAYYHPENNPDYLYSFKGEPVYLTKELLPDYWAEICSTASRTDSNGITYLAFCDRKTSSYWRGTYNAATDDLELHHAKTETILRHFAGQYGVPLADDIPEWDMSFNPHDSVRVDFNARTVNTFQLTRYMKAVAKKTTMCPPTILKVLHHALGSNVEVTDHFVNWVAFILQNRAMTRTSWVLHGTQGCLAGDTELQFNRGARNGGRPLTVKKAFEKWTGQFVQGTGIGKSWDMSIGTRTKAVKDGLTIGYHEVFNIVESGEKQLYKLTTTKGRTIRVTELHPFLRPDGSYTPLNELRVGDKLVVEGKARAHIKAPAGRKTRHTTHSLQYHPTAWDHWIGGKNYKRNHTARLVVEAARNGLSLEDFIAICRTSPEQAAGLFFLPKTDIVHHKDEDPSNDTLSNLVVVDKLNHDTHHAKEVGLGTITTEVETIKSIKIDKIEMTYDIVMKAPYHNYIANGFAVHNTGKGILMSQILRPIFGSNQTVVKRLEEFNEQYNDYMRNTFIVFVDEFQIKALQNERGAMSKIKNFITEPRVPMRAMYQGALEIDNYTNWIFASNEADSMTVPPNDRRTNVAQFQPNKLPITQSEIDQIENELQQFHDFLLHYPVDVDAAHTPLDTDDRNILISISQTSLDSTAEAILTGNMGFFMDQMPSSDRYGGNALNNARVTEFKQALADIMERTDTTTGRVNISRDELQALFKYCNDKVPESPNKFTTMLKHHRIYTTKVRVGDKSVYGVQVKFNDLKHFPGYVKEHFTAKKSQVAEQKNAKRKTK